MFEYFHKEIPPMFLGAILAVFVAFIRVIYDREETSFVRILLESVLCGTLALIAGTGIEALGLNQDWSLFVGGMIGFVGSQSIRTYAHLFLKQKISGK
ncbi:phage holin, lambda family [Marisediminitalea sp.]|uniref:phage holin, lambda family n=1 Tax=Marisediminitalea sp. TaxID=2662268 RepID=UPI003516DE47